MRKSASSKRIAQQHEQRKASLAAKSSSARFTTKQSPFQLRHEERVHTSNHHERVNHTHSRSEIPLDDKNGNNSNSKVFSRFESRKPVEPSQSMAMSTTSTATFGLSAPRHTRSTRRAAKFRLPDETNAVHPAMAPSPGGLLGGVSPHAMHGSHQSKNNYYNNNTTTTTTTTTTTIIINNAMDNNSNINNRQHRVRQRSEANNNNNDNNNNEDDEDEAPRQRSRAERFSEILANSKGHRAQLQRQRAERAEQTTALDAAFNDLAHLLQTRHRDEEARERFAKSGTQEVRALLAEKRLNRPAKSLTLRSDGTFTVEPLIMDEETPPVQLMGKNNHKKITTATRTTTTTTVTTTAPQDLTVYSHKGDTFAEADDDFDRLMHSMRMDSRRAAAAERTPTDAESAALKEAQSRLAEDRAVIPSLAGHDAAERLQLTRAEWIARGGDAAHQMDADEAHMAHSDGIDISSAESLASDDDDDNNNSNSSNKDVYMAREFMNDTDYEKCEMSEKDTHEGGKAASQLDMALMEMDQFSRAADHTRAGRDRRQVQFTALLQKLYHCASLHLLHAAQTFRLVLLDAQKSFLRHRTIDPPRLVCLLALARLFPSTDYRHEVVTPFRFFLAAAALQSRVDSMESVRRYACVAGLLCENTARLSGKFCAESVIAAMNLLAMQVPLAELEPARFLGLRVPFPIIERIGPAALGILLLHTQKKEEGSDDHDDHDNNNNNNNNNTKPNTNLKEKSDPEKSEPISILETDVTARDITLYAYRLLFTLADTYRALPALSACLVEPFHALHHVLHTSPLWNPCDAVRNAHDALLNRLEIFDTAVRQTRTPLAMRSFRPRPIRQFEPLLQESATSAVKNEMREIRRELREDRKRVVRHLQAEAAVERRGRERENENEEAQRDQKYRDLMGQLQAQQHTMNTVDGLMQKARAKKRKGISGNPTSGAGGEEGGGGGGEE